MDFQWDEKKRKLNLSKHGMDFVDARHLFDGPMLVHLDTREEYQEPRWIGIGFIKGVCALVAFTERGRGRTIRIISLRKATTHERNAFEKALEDRLGQA